MTATEDPTEPASQAPSQERSLKLDIPEEGEAPTQAPTEVLHCSKCGSEVTQFETPTGTRYRCPQCGGFVKPAEKVTAEEEKEEGGAPLKPPDVEATDFVVAQLKVKLPNIYGIGNKALAIAQSVEGNPQIALNPNTLFFHIKQLAPRANDYQLYLLLSGIFQKMQRERYLQTPSPFPIITPMPQRTSFPQTFPQTNQPGWNPWQTPTSPFQTPQRMPTSDVQRFEEYSENARMKREEHDLRMKKLEEEIKSIVSQRTTAKTNGETSSVVVTEPLRDDKGKLVYDNEGKIVYKRIVGPKGQVETLSGDDPEVRLLNKMQRYKDIMKSDLDEAKIRTIIKETLPTKEEKPLTKEDLDKAATTAAQTVLATKEQEDKDERRHKELLQAVTERSSSKVVEGYKSDSYRFMGQSLDHLAGVIEKKEPIKIIVDLLREAPPEKTVEKEAREGIFNRIHPKLVAEE